MELPLWRHWTTGEGRERVSTDLSQYEAGLQFISSALLDYAGNGVIGRRDGNRDPTAVPHGCYPCRDGRWCAISCWDEEEWVRFCRGAEKPSWLSDTRFSSRLSRKKNEVPLNQLIAAWTQDRDAGSVMHLLQDCGVHAAAVNTMQDVFSDPQIAFRKIWQELDHPEIGRHHYRMVSYHLSDTPGSIRRPAPRLGEHNEEVFLEWLGMSREEFQEFLGQGVFS